MENPKRRRTPVNQSRPILYIGWDDRPHHYIEKFMRYVEQTSPGVGDHHIQVLHDDWCAFFKGRACNCDPEVREMLGGSGIGT
jgi:hypothetical protein